MRASLSRLCMGAAVVLAPALYASPAPPDGKALAHCDSYVGPLYDAMAKRAAAGMTEREALDELSARGDYALGYVIDGVFAKGVFAAGTPGGSANRAEVMRACRRLAAGGTLY